MLGLWLLGGVAVLAAWWSLGYRMAQEAGRYAVGALRDRPKRTQDVGWLIAFSIGWSLWLPLTIFNWLIFKTAYPVTAHRLVPRRR